VILLQISAGQGPAECARAVALILRRLTEEARACGVELTLLEAEKAGQPDAFGCVVVGLEGPEAARNALAGRWVGTVQWICQSPFRANYRRKNWFVGITSFETAEEAQLDIKEVRFETLRASGAGGQHVNKTESAVRAIHGKSGLSVKVQSERSQHANKRWALILLARKLAQLASQEAANGRTSRRLAHHSLERGNAGLVFVGPTFQEGAAAIVGDAID
jgi:peptide chain release factor